MIDSKIIESVKKAREEGKTIGLVQGSWDMFHIGHFRYLLAAKEQCDFLVVGIDDDEKIKYRKGESRPIIPLKERYEMIEKIGVADVIAIKSLDEQKWELIKTIHPDVLIAISENYSKEKIEELKKHVGGVTILPRQATTSTSDIVRKSYLSYQKKLTDYRDKRVEETVEAFKQRLGIKENIQLDEPIPQLIETLKTSNDWQTPVAAACFWNEKWYFGANKIDTTLNKNDIENRSELFYSTVEHAEINLLKQLDGVEVLDTPVYVTLFPCDKCMKVLIDKGVKEIYYLEDHLERNWSKRSHELARKKGVKTTQLILNPEVKKEEDFIAVKYEPNKYKYIEPMCVRKSNQLEIMLEKETNGIDPLDPEYLDQPILFTTKHWYISENRFPYDEINHQFLIASRNPIYKVEDMSPEMWIELNQIWQMLNSDYEISGGALCFRFGEPVLSGASLKRLHCHLIVPKMFKKTRFPIGCNGQSKLVRKIHNENKGEKD